VDRKEQLRLYKETPPPMGVYLVRNTAAGTAWLGSSVNIPGMLNRLRFQLDVGSHSDPTLQREYNEFGSAAFEYLTLDTLEPSIDPDYDPKDDLVMLEDMWLERLSSEHSAHPLASGSVVRISASLRKSRRC